MFPDIKNIKLCKLTILKLISVALTNIINRHYSYFNIHNFSLGTTKKTPPYFLEIKFGKMLLNKVGKCRFTINYY